MRKPQIAGALAALLLAAGSMLLAQAPRAADQAVELSAEPHHRLVLENDYAKVWTAEIPPHQSTLMHHHNYDYLLIALVPTHFQNQPEGKAPVDMRQQPGEVGFAKGGLTHKASNEADTPFRNITVELLKPERAKEIEAAPNPQERALDIGHGSVTDTVFQNDRVEVQEVEIAPGAMQEKQHYGRPQLLVPISDLELESHNVGKPDTWVRLKSGEVLWIPGGQTRMLMNVGKQQAEFVLVQFKH